MAFLARHTGTADAPLVSWNRSLNERSWAVLLEHRAAHAVTHARRWTAGSSWPPRDSARRSQGRARGSSRPREPDALGRRASTEPGRTCGLAPRAAALATPGLS